MSTVFGVLILICLLNESVKVLEAVPKKAAKDVNERERILKLYKKEAEDVNERDKKLKAMFNNHQENNCLDDEFQSNGTIFSKVWHLFRHCSLNVNNLAKLILNVHA
ncbi:unnamed protein product [Schistosoma turkestanicum]|nr:unnamed protein product [Schistosoma turkestanicum]